ncbi:spore gernimation protein [Lysinibacillus contaminans]|uniref:Spore gernimation protein n=1 Tax=Lysinibacillus contaminans TaxID=1293441 RepID=A0ABR5JZ91_9BACI|nr:GerAB/ArcD/ProY family transporter [Lysinibacillus contaminans]KOS67963.1 spore gernimation protein [Lysinibacillus contaminans]
MSTHTKKILNGYHVVFLAQSAMIGSGILTLPRELSSVGYSQTFLPILFGVFASLTLWPMVWLNLKYPNENLFRINEILLGKGLGKILNVLIILQFTLFIAGIINKYMHLIQSTALPEQTITKPVLLFLLLLIYIVNGGIKSIARFCMLTFFLTIGIFYFTYWAVQKGDFSHLFPLFNFNGKELFEAMGKGYLAVLGYGAIMFYFPYIVDQKKAFKHVLTGIWISISLCFITVLISVMYFSEWQLKHIEFSILNLLKSGELSFVERFDIIGVTLWVFLILTTVAVYLWSAKEGIVSLFSKEKKYYIYVLTAIVFLIVRIPFPQEFQDKFFTTVNYIAYFLIVWPSFLSIIYLLRKKQVQP